MSKSIFLLGLSSLFAAVNAGTVPDLAEVSQVLPNDWVELSPAEGASFKHRIYYEALFAWFQC